MRTILSVMVLLLADGTEERTLMTSLQCRMDLLVIGNIAAGGANLIDKNGNQIVQMFCEPWRMGQSYDGPCEVEGS